MNKSLFVVSSKWQKLLVLQVDKKDSILNVPVNNNIINNI